MKDFGPRTWFSPLPVLIIGTYDENGVPNAMNVGWGSIADTELIDINLAKDRKTVDNLMLKKCFTAAFATVSTLEESDYFGMVHGYGFNKLEKAGMKWHKSSKIDAPVIEGYPMVLECEVTHVSEEDIDGGYRVFGRIVNVLADEEVCTDGVPDVSKMDLICLDPMSHSYVTVGKAVGRSYQVGNRFKD